MSDPALGDTWTDTTVFETAWWREYRWTVVAKRHTADATVWLLRPEDKADGTWPDVSIGVVDLRIGQQVARSSWYTRGWVAKAHKVELGVTNAPGYPEPALIAVTERFEDKHGAIGVNEYFFRRIGSTLELLDEVVTVDPTAGTVRDYEFRFVPAPTLTFQTVVDGHIETFVLDATSNRFKSRSGASGS